MVTGVRQWTMLTHVGPGYNWDGWPSSGVYTISGCNQPTRSTQPCIPTGSLNRVPASAGVKAGMSPLPGGRYYCVIPYGTWVPVAVRQVSCELSYIRILYFTLLYSKLGRIVRELQFVLCERGLSRSTSHCTVADLSYRPGWLHPRLG